MAVRRMSMATLVVAIALIIVEGSAAAMGTVARTTSTRERLREARNLLKRINKDPVASIQSPDGDIIDCVHISKQPAFDHPLLNNHTIQMRPSSYPRGLFDVNNIAPYPITQTWHQNGKCPENTVPIRRTKEEDVLRASSIKGYGKKKPGSIPNVTSTGDPDASDVTKGHQHTVGSTLAGNRYYGTKTCFNLWQPKIARANDFSLAQFWISSGSYAGNDLNTIEAGWQVYPYLYGDSNPRLFIYWTPDAYKTGCYNLLCGGFIQTNNQIAIGGSISPVSIYGGSQYDIDILAWKDPQGGNWWLQVGGYYLGYWPSNIFSNLADSASTVQWGGEVFSGDAGQTSTQMGSGHFPNEGFRKASHIKNINVVDSSNYLQQPSVVGLIAKQPNCYNVQSATTNTDWGTYMYYGRPGKNPTLQEYATIATVVNPLQRRVRSTAAVLPRLKKMHYSDAGKTTRRY